MILKSIPLPIQKLLAHHKRRPCSNGATLAHESDSQRNAFPTIPPPARNSFIRWSHTDTVPAHESSPALLPPRGCSPFKCWGVTSFTLSPAVANSTVAVAPTHVHVGGVSSLTPRDETRESETDISIRMPCKSCGQTKFTFNTVVCR